MIVLDASAVAELLLRTPKGDAVARRITSARTLHAPQLMTLEVASVLRRHTLRGTLDETRADAALDVLEGLAFTLHDHAPLLRRVWALRRNLTAYDAVYVALAEALRAVLVTCDRGLATAPGHSARVEHVTARSS